ncbi:MAG: hypothetical protein WCA07_12225 [Gloeobacterales cyanobacterium]
MLTYLPVDKLCSFVGIDTEKPEPSRRQIEQARERVRLFPDTKGFPSILIARKRADGKFETDLSPTEIACYQQLALTEDDLKELPFYIINVTDEQMASHAIGVRKGSYNPIAIRKTRELSQLGGPLRQAYIQKRLPEGKALSLNGLKQWPEFLTVLYKKLQEEGLSKFRSGQLKQMVGHFKSELLERTESEVLEDLEQYSFTSWKPNLNPEVVNEVVNNAETVNDISTDLPDNCLSYGTPNHEMLSTEQALKFAGSLPTVEEGEEKDPDSFMKDWQAVRHRIAETSGKSVTADELRLWILWILTGNGDRIFPQWSEEMEREGVTTPEEVKQWLERFLEFSDAKAVFRGLMIHQFGVTNPNENPFMKGASTKSKLKAKRDSVFENKQRRTPKLLGYKAEDLGEGKALVAFHESKPSRHEFRYTLDKAIESLGKDPQQMPYGEIEIMGIDSSCFEELGVNKNGRWFPSQPISVHIPEREYAMLKYCSRPSEQRLIPALLEGKIFALKVMESRKPVIVCQLPNFGRRDFSMEDLHLHPADVAKILRIDKTCKHLAGKVIRYEDCVVLSA